MFDIVNNVMNFALEIYKKNHSVFSKSLYSYGSC